MSRSLRGGYRPASTHCIVPADRLKCLGFRLLSGQAHVETIYDWVTVGIFAGLIVLFLQRSTGSEPAEDTIWHYMPPAAGCAVANYAGNEGQDLLAIAIIAAVLVYIAMVLKPLAPRSR